MEPKAQKPHPLAGRSGIGSPFAPAGWGWRCGYRIKDMYFYSPCKKLFRSQVQLNAFLKSIPGSPLPSEFRWSFSPTDYQDGSPLPGNPPSISRKLVRRSPKDDATPSQCIQNYIAEIESTPRLRSFSRLDEDLENGRRGNQLHEAHRGKRLFEGSPDDESPRKRPRDDSLEKFVREGASIQGKSSEEIGALKALVEAKSIGELQQCAVEVLRVYYRLLRLDEDPPACFGVSELSRLCSNWVCKHKHPWCFWERSYILLLQSQREELLDARRNELEGLMISAVSCHREGCCSDPAFCSGCSCSICKGPIQGNICSWSLIRCPTCHHAAHLECALSEKKAGVVPEKGLDLESLCESCSQKSDLVLLWKTAIEEGLASGSMREQSLSAAARLADGTKRVYFQPLLAKVKALRNSDPVKHPEVLQALKEVVESIGEYDDRLMDESLVTEILEAGPGWCKLDVAEEERRAAELQKKAEAEYSGWLGAEKLAEARRLLVKQMQGDLEKAEAEARVRRGSAAASLAEFQKAEKRVRLLSMFKRMNGVSGKVVELQRWNCEQELERLEALQKRIDGAKVDKWPRLYKAFEAQDKRLRAARSHLKHLSCLQKLLSSEE